MFSTREVAAACGVEKVTIRAWLARAPGFRLGEYVGLAKNYTRTEALTLLIAGELISRGYGTPYEVLPLSRRIASGPADRTVWISRDCDGALTFSDRQPHDVAIALPLDTLARRLTRSATPESGRLARYTR